MIKITWKDIFHDFKKRHPELIRRGTTFMPYAYSTIELRIPEVGRALYNWDNKKVEWLDRYVDPKTARMEHERVRQQNVTRFIQLVSIYMREHEMTHQQFADYVGISRCILSKYLNGYATPKLSTMKHICECIGVTIF